MATKNILNSLSDLGLSKYESRIYLTLIGEGITTAKTISDITGIPYGKVYEIINTLSHKGFVMTLPSKPMKYKAVSPQQAIHSAKKEASEKLKKIEKHVLEYLEPLFTKSKSFTGPKSDFRVINGRANIVKKTDEMIKKAEKNINIHCSANSLSRLVLHKEALKEAADRGICISIAGSLVNSNSQDIRPLSFCDLRCIKSSENNLISIDGNECMVINPKPDDDNIIYGRDIGISAVSKSFTRFMDIFFETSFRKAREIRF